ncbi:MauE/DoxX family redox-associated membrane protein [Myroides sp. LJL119]
MRARYIQFVSYFLVVLFVYASVSKLIVFSEFQIQLTQSPLLSAYAKLISYLVIITELILAVILASKKTRLLGLYLSYGLMLAFSLYIYLILNYSDFVPCSCGGVLENLGWNEHLWFNIIVSCLTIVAAYLLENKDKRFWWAFTAITLLSSFFIICVFLSSEYIIKKENPFIRRYLPHGMVEDKEIDLQVNTFYFSGTHNNSVYLGNTLSPLRFILVDSLLKRQDFQISIDSTDFGYRYLKLKTVYPYFFLGDGSIPIVFNGRLDNTMQVKQSSVFSFKDTYFTDFIPMDSSKIVFKAQIGNDLTHVLGILQQSSPRVEINVDILSSFSTGSFATDGLLAYSDNYNDVIYTYYYSNRYLTANKNLQEIDLLKTIDTTSIANVSSSRLSNGTDKKITPMSAINRKITVKDNLLFIVSNSLGQNDSKNVMKQASIIDIYDFRKGIYVASFLIYHNDDQKLSDIIFTNQYAYGLFGSKLVRFRLARNLTDKFVKDLPSP